MTNLFFRLTLGVLLTLGIGANAQEANQAKPAGGPREGIKVHGHWTIEVRNPNGKLVTHREFENALNNGQLTLGPVLGRTATVGFWVVDVWGVNGNPPGPCLGNGPGFCFITESTDSVDSGQNVFKNLTVSAPLPGNPGAGTLTLSGTFTVQNNSQIGLVGTEITACPPAVAPANCPPLITSLQNGGSLFSSANFTPVSVTIGQLVQITVVFSFS
jgi:hypothetical protein